MRLSVFGLGYVGSVTAACMASLGHHVIGVDINPLKTETLSVGRSPVLEARMDELVADAYQVGRLSATSDAHDAIRESELSFVCVATPSLRNGKLDLSSLIRVCREIGQALRHKSAFHTIVVRSTVLPGTADSLVVPTLQAASCKQLGADFTVCMNPEFMREGSAVFDFFNPPFVVIGSVRQEHARPLRELYSFAPGEIFETSLTAAEMVKYACNAFHAVKISFANEIGTLCQYLGLDPTAVVDIFTRDTKLNISKAYLTPGFAFGGSCLPKDLRALTYRAKELDLRLPLLESILLSNSEHIERAVQAVLETGKRKIGVLGLSFKAGTDDLRESPSVQLIKRLLGEGCQIDVWDENVSLGSLVGSNRQFIEAVIPHIGSLLRGNMQAVIAAADLVLIGTKEVEKEHVASLLRPDQILINLTRLEESQPVVKATAAS
ncbi:MAG: GDP-mannose dehydrogenase [Acidobacteria bacterium]|nr:MAG: GDP-mannose dehydrogenase [Acidobacteriota bacterium]